MAQNMAVTTVLLRLIIQSPLNWRSVFGSWSVSNVYCVAVQNTKNCLEFFEPQPQSQSNLVQPGTLAPQRYDTASAQYTTARARLSLVSAGLGMNKARYLSAAAVTRLMAVVLSLT